MASNRSNNFLGNQRVDVPHLKLLEAGVRGDFDTLAGQILAGNIAQIVSGFTIQTSGLVGQAATNIQVFTAGATMLHPLATASGTVFKVPSDRATETLSSTNGRVVGSFVSGTTNYIGIDLVREADDATTDQVQFLDVTTDEESPKRVPLSQTLDYRIYISTQDFESTPGIAPLAIVVTSTSNTINSIQDARDLFFRLGSGGTAPDSNYTHPWAERTESTSDFTVADKSLASLKDWVNAAMTRLWELGGGESWFSQTADRNVRMIRLASATVFASTGDWFEFTGGHLHWRGLAVIFDNSTGHINEIKDQATNSTGLTDLTDGYCIYVDLDRSQNLTAGNALQPYKAQLSTLGLPTKPGSRYIIAWNYGGSIYTRDGQFFVGVTQPVATTSAVGTVKLNQTPGSSSAPVVTSIDSNGAINVTATATGSISTFAVTGTGASSVITTASSGVKGTGGSSTTGGSFHGGRGVEGVGGGSDYGDPGDGVKGTGGAASTSTTNGGKGGVFVGGAGTTTGGAGPGIQATGGTTGTGGAHGKGGIFAGGNNAGGAGAAGDGLQSTGGSNTTGPAGKGGVFVGGAATTGTPGYGIHSTGGSSSTDDGSAAAYLQGGNGGGGNGDFGGPGFTAQAGTNNAFGGEIVSGNESNETDAGIFSNWAGGGLQIKKGNKNNTLSSLRFVGSTGVPTNAFNHLGFPTQEVSKFEEFWFYGDNTNMDNASPWTLTATGTGSTTTRTLTNPASGYAANTIVLTATSTIGFVRRVFLNTTRAVFPSMTYGTSNYFVGRLDFNVSVDVVDSATEVWVGISDAVSSPMSATSTAIFRYIGGTDGGGTWRTYTRNAGGESAKDTAVAITGRQQLTIELYGSASERGGGVETVLFYIDGQLVETHTTTGAADYVPNLDTQICCAVLHTNVLAGATRTLSVGPVTAYWNRGWVYGK